MPASNVRTIEPRIDAAALDAVLAPFDQLHQPGAMVGVAIDGIPRYRRAVGLADMDLPLALTPSTRLRVGSVTKQFSCLAYLLLCEDGKAGLDDRLGAHLPEVHANIHDVTMRQLMAHMSGIRDAYSLFLRFNDARDHHAGASQRVGNAELMHYYQRVASVEAAPGTAWSYSNGGYLLLGAVIERIAGRELGGFLAERVFRPIGMHDTELLLSDTRFVGNRGSQHVCAVDGGYERLTYGLDNFAGGGAAISTLDDLLRWLAHIDHPSVGSPASWRELLARQRLANGHEVAYGFGVQLGRYRGLDLVSHAGGAFGGGAHVLKVPAAGLDIAVLVNRQDAYAPSIAHQVADLCLPGLPPPPHPDTDGPILVGHFINDSGSYVIELSESRGQQAGAINGLDLLYRRHGGVLRHAGDLNEDDWTVTPIGEGETPEALQLDLSGRIETLRRMAPADGAPMPPVGTFCSAELETDAAVVMTGDQAMLTTRGPYGSVRYRLDHLSGTVYRARGCAEYRGSGVVGAIVNFASDGEAFLFSSSLTAALRFERRS